MRGSAPASGRITGRGASQRHTTRSDFDYDTDTNTSTRSHPSTLDCWSIASPGPNQPPPPPPPTSPLPSPPRSPTPSPHSPFQNKRGGGGSCRTLPPLLVLVPSLVITMHMAIVRVLYDNTHTIIRMYYIYAPCRGWFSLVLMTNGDPLTVAHCLAVDY